MAEQRNAGRRVISQAEADAIAAKSGVQKPNSAAKPKGPGVNRREVLAIAMAGSAALLTAGGLLFITSPDPAADPLLGPLLKFTAAEDPTTGERTYPVAGGFAYPRIKAGTFGGKFTLDKKASEFKDGDDPFPVADGKFFVVKVASDASIQPVADEDGQANPDGIMAIYQVCVHLGCLVPYIASEKRFICPCHGSTYERDTKYVRGPAPRNLDQFRVKVVNDTIIVNTGQRVLGESHA
ncbi:MAG TPA: Rieske 2Fe-2S domain-containing protein [Kouleothrix sp.]|uniref:QcrA and Rieske domain-containing protein n=1 Tax=Kouleothrix sp. TaxID=2779161 RepID=UPI002B7BD572|nr:Rieske 2Fe-2S domain-containing protein [Kouleothrix sp.]